MTQRPARLALLADPAGKWRGSVRRLAAAMSEGGVTGQILSNSAWMVTDKFLRAVLALPVTLWVARYLGVDEFGRLSYATSFVLVFAVLATIGLDSQLIRDMVRSRHERNVVLASGFWLKTAGSAVGFVMAVAAAVVVDPRRGTDLILVVIFAGAMFLQPFDVIDFWFRARSQSRRAVVAKLFGFFAGLLARLGVVAAHGDVVDLALVSLAEACIGAAGLVWIYFLGGHDGGRFTASWPYMRELLKRSWPLLLSGLAVVLYMRLDTLMLQHMSGSEAVGIYAAATRLSELWYAIPVVVATAAFPSLVHSHDQSDAMFCRNMRRLYFWFAWMAVVIALPVSIASGWLVPALFGDEYRPASVVLAIHVWSCVAVYLGVASGQFLVIRNLQAIAFYRTMLGLICNIVLNFLLIPRYGPAGAALATLVSYTVATFSLVLFSQSRSEGKNLILAPLTGAWR
jgi:PST family polysaccharide transporter